MINTMNNNSLPLDELKQRYAEYIVDGMDMDSLVQFAIDSVYDAIKDWDEEELKDEVTLIYDEEVWEDLVESVQ